MRTADVGAVGAACYRSATGPDLRCPNDRRFGLGAARNETVGDERGQGPCRNLPWAALPLAILSLYLPAPAVCLEMAGVRRLDRVRCRVT